MWVEMILRNHCKMVETVWIRRLPIVATLYVTLKASRAKRNCCPIATYRELVSLSVSYQQVARKIAVQLPGEEILKAVRIFRAIDVCPVTLT